MIKVLITIAKMFVRLDSNNFDGLKSQLVKDLGAGERRCYSSTLTRHWALVKICNIIYTFKVAKMMLLKSTSLRTKKEMDIEGIYLDKPTSIINKCGGNDTMIQ